MVHELDNLTIGTFAKLADVSVETIRFYQRKKLLRTPVKFYGTIRRYTSTDVKRVKFIKAAQKLGFTLEEIAKLLFLEDGTHCLETKEIAEAKLNNIRQKISHLKSLENTLVNYISNCSDADANSNCPLISKLFNDE